MVLFCSFREKNNKDQIFFSKKERKMKKTYPLYKTPSSSSSNSVSPRKKQMTSKCCLHKDGLDEGCIMNFEFCIRLIMKIYYYEKVSHSHIVKMTTIEKAFEKLGIYDVRLLFAYSAAGSMSMKAGVLVTSLLKNVAKKEFTKIPTANPVLSLIGIMGKIGNTESVRGMVAFRGTLANSDWAANLTFQRINIFPRNNLSTKVRQNSDSLLDSQPLLGPLPSRFTKHAVYIHEGFFNLYTRNTGLEVVKTLDDGTIYSRCFCASLCEGRLRNKAKECLVLPAMDISKIDVPCELEETEIKSGSIRCGDSSQLSPSIQQQIMTYKNTVYSGVTEWIVTGHSLGGALATITATHLELLQPGSVVGLYTIASPMVGERTFSNLFHDILHLGDRTFRLYHLSDPVPNLPYYSIPVGRPFPIDGTPVENSSPHSLEKSYLPLTNHFLLKSYREILARHEQEQQKKGGSMMKNYGKPALSMAAALYGSNYGIPPMVTDALVNTALTAAGAVSRRTLKTFVLPEDPYSPVTTTQKLVDDE